MNASLKWQCYGNVLPLQIHFVTTYIYSTTTRIMKVVEFYIVVDQIQETPSISELNFVHSWVETAIFLARKPLV